MNFGNPWFKENDDGIQVGISSPGFRRSPVETMAFNLYAMSESRKEELRDLARNLVDFTDNTYGTQYLSQDEVDFVLEECQRIRELDYKRNYVGGMHNGYYGL